MLAPMFGMGFGELLMIAVIALLFLGPEKLPEAAKTISKGIRDLRRSTKDLQQTIEKDTQLGSAMREIKSALRGDDVRQPPRPPGATGTGGATKPGLTPGGPSTPAISAKATPATATTADATAATTAPAASDTSAAPASATPADTAAPPDASASAAPPDASASAAPPDASASAAPPDASASAAAETTADAARGSDGDDVSELAASLIRPAPSSVPQSARPATPDRDAHDADGPGKPAAGSGSAHG
jgi:sec-independent protein translocase protein TatB